MPLGLGGDEALRQHLLDIGLHDGRDLVLAQIGLVLGRDDDGGRAHRAAVLVIEGDLALGVGLQARLLARMAGVGQGLQDVVAVLQGGRHQLGRLVRGVAEHDALVARALVLVGAGVDALGDVGRLRVQVVLELERLPVEAVLLIADVLDHLADHGLDLVLDARGPLALGVHDALAADLAGDHHQIGRRQGLARHARLGVLGQEQVDDGVRNLVGDLVGMAFRDALGGEEERRTGQGRLLRDDNAARHIKICLYVQGGLRSGGPGVSRSAPRGDGMFLARRSILRCSIHYGSKLRSLPGCLPVSCCEAGPRQPALE
ncbi:hypothetical protein D3C73_902080 [compost metagenome]